MADTILISEIFGPTVQGEGHLIGTPTLFVRTGGCDFRCSWCDTLHAVDARFRKDWYPMTAEDILKKLQSLSNGKPILVTLSGGNPAIQPFAPLLKIGKEQGFTFALETQGSIAKPWFSELNVLTLSPKPPSSGMSFDREKLQDCIESAKNSKTPPTITLKFVVFDEKDFTFAEDVSTLHPDIPVVLQVGNEDIASPTDLTEGKTVNPNQETLLQKQLWLTEQALKAGWNTARVLPQLHVWLWGGKKGV